MKNSLKLLLYACGGMISSSIPILSVYAQSTHPTYGNLTPVRAINTPLSEAYPYLSEDSKRLYFIRGEKGRGELMFTSRSSNSVPFTTAPTNFSYKVGNVASTGYLSNVSSFYLSPTSNCFDGSISTIERDLFTIYYETGIQKMRVFTRANSTGFFTDNVNKIVNHDLNSACWSSSENITSNPVFYYSPSLFRQKNIYKWKEYVNNSIFTHYSYIDLYLHYRTSDGKKGIAYLKQLDNGTGGGKYSFVFKYRLAENVWDATTSTAYETQGGTISKDGTRFYVNLRNKKTGKTSLYYIATDKIAIANINTKNPDNLNDILGDDTYTNPNAVSNSNNFANYVLVHELEGNATQPSFSNYNATEHKQDMALVINNSGGYWENNDIYLSKFDYEASDNKGPRLAEKSTIATLFAPVPNPSKGDVTFNFSLPEDTQKASINIFSVEGMLIKSINIDDLSSDFISTKLDDINTGLYYCILVSDKGKSSQRLAIIK